MTSSSSEHLRQEVCLNGVWDFKSEVDAEWCQINVPGNYSYLRTGKWGKHYWDIFQYPARWTEAGATYRRTLEIPASMEGRRLKVYIGGCHYYYAVYLNGQLIGQANDGYFPHEFLLNEHLQEKGNVLEVRVSGERHYTTGGESMASRGIWQDVSLRAYNSVIVEESLFIRTLLNDQKLACDVPVHNESTAPIQFTIRNIVLDANGAEVLDFESDTCALEPGQSATYLTETSWENPHLWFPHDPYLYHLKSTLVNSSGKVLDEKTTRFGYREITWKGPHLFLNNRELFLRGHGGHYLGDLQGTKDYARQWFRSLKEHGINFMRMHIYPRHRELYEIADEEGFLFEAEPAYHFRVPEDQALAKEHLGRLIITQRNHPSVIMWSVSNELRWSGGGEKPFLIDHAKTLDPTRPVFSSDFSAFSTAGDIVSHHYDWEVVWDDWEKYGPDKPMVWDEVASVWQPERPMDNYTAGYEVSAQDYATGLGYDGRIQMQRNLEFVQHGRVINGEHHRINGLIPWDFSYNFFRWQPLNNHQGLQPEWPSLEGSGVKAKSIGSCASTLNIWDDVLPIFEPNPGYYLFKDYIQAVRFWDEAPSNTLSAGESLTLTSKLFYEDMRLVDEVETRLEDLQGNALFKKRVPFSIQPGEMRDNVSLTFEVPQVSESTKVNLVRQFFHQGEAGYCHSLPATIFPPAQAILSQKVSGRTIGVHAVSAPLIKILEQSGATVIPIHDVTTLSSEEVDLIITQDDASLRPQDEFNAYLAAGGKALSLPSANLKHDLQDDAQATKCFLDRELTLTEIPSFLEGATLLQTADADSAHGNKLETKPEFIHLKVNVAVTVYIGYDWEMFAPKNWFSEFSELFDQYIHTDDEDTFFRVAKRDFDAGDIHLGENLTGDPEKSMYTVFLVPQHDEEKSALKVEVVSVASGQDYVIADEPARRTEIRNRPSIRFLVNGAKHRLLQGLGAEDFASAKVDDFLTPIMKASTPANQRVILGGDRHGDSIALLEKFIGRGLTIESGIDFSQCLDQGPFAYLFANILDYQLGYQSAANSSAVTALVGANWKAKLDELEVEYTNWGSNLAGSSILVDAADPQVLQTLQSHQAQFADFVQAGGTILALDVVEASLPILSEILGKPLELTEPFLGETEHCVKAAITWKRRDTPKELVEYYDSTVIPAPFEWNYDPLLSGIANADLNWDSGKMLDHGITIKGMDPVFASPDYNILISNWKIDWSRPIFGGEYTHLARDERRYNWFLNRDPVLLKINQGQGRVLLSTLKFKENAPKSTPLLLQLLTNLNVSVGGANRFASDEATFDLSDQSQQQERFASHYYPTPAVRNTDVEDNVFVQESSKKPELLLIGDHHSSIYFDRTAQLLQHYGVTHQLTYEGGTQTCLDLLREKGEAGLSQYDIIYLASGWGDLAQNDARNAEAYEDTVIQLIELLSKTSSKVYWGTQLPLPQQQTTYLDQVASYRSMATKQMNQSDIYLVDVGSFAEKEFTDYLAGDKLLLGDSETEALARQVNAAIQFFGE